VREVTALCLDSRDTGNGWVHDPLLTLAGKLRSCTHSFSSDSRPVSLSTGNGHTVDEHSKRICNKLTFCRVPGLGGRDT
jgi:hypothetical protein